MDYLCVASRDCMNLSMAYHVLKDLSPPTDEISKETYQDLLTRLKPYYKCGGECPLKSNTDIGDLLYKTIEYLKTHGLRRR